MEAKLRQLMKHEGINSTRLAEILGIQASGISHIMSGRNKPSFDFLLKLLQRFPQINPDWLLLDKGPMYRDEIKNNGAVDGSRHNAKIPSAGSGAGIDFDSGSKKTTEGFVTGGRSGNTAAIAFGELFEPEAAAYPGAHSGNSGTDKQRRTSDGDIIHSDKYPDSITDTGKLSAGPSDPSANFSAPPPSASLSEVHSVYPTGGFTRSASIERIVVFYKDKTFSEYLPG